jgi:hypothetical protein
VNDSPGRVVQSRLACTTEGALAEVILDSSHAAWARCCTDGTWTPWVPVAAGVIDVDITAAPPGGTVIALVIATPASPAARRADGRMIHQITAAGIVTGTAL